MIIIQPWVAFNYFNNWLLRRSLQRDDGGPGCSNWLVACRYSDSWKQCDCSVYHRVWGLPSSADCSRLEAFLCRSVSFGYWDALAPSLAHIFVQADDKLFDNILHIMQCIMINICSAHSSNQKGTNIILSVTAVTACTSALSNVGEIAAISIRCVRSSSELVTNSTGVCHTQGPPFPGLGIWDSLRVECDWWYR